ncbi:transcriptional regulator MraZ [Bacteroidia bacterium]|nr:transcriptional regulator MraZ [Bacteroidia bacterium]
MERFIGNMDAKLDAKGRVFVPAAFRKILQSFAGTRLILRKDVYQNCLILYPEKVWEDEVEYLRKKLNRWNRDEDRLFRQLSSNVENLDIDSGGRILIPKRYMQMLNISDVVRFMGMDYTIELWNPAELEKSLMSPEEFEKNIQKYLGAKEN